MLSIILQKSRNRYLLVGVTVFAIELLVIVIAQMSGLSDIAAVSLGFWIGIILSFCLQKIVGFSDTRFNHKLVTAQVVAYGLLVIINYCFTLLMTQLLAAILPVLIIRSISLVITTLWNYYVYKVHIFAAAKEI